MSSSPASSFHAPGLSLGLSTALPLRRDGCGVAGLTAEEAEREFRDTVAYWRRWIGRCRYRGRWREMVNRSALALKLLTYEPTGAIVAAPTCGLPEGIGGERNWDYRYTWIRDASFTLYGLMRVGFTEEADRFMDWLRARIGELTPEGALQTMYSIEGRHELKEESLNHLEGYRGSHPVRIGNGAYNQLQLDIYGELMDAVYLFNKYGTPIGYDLWVNLRRLLNWVVDHWQQPDEGLWEVRGGRQHFVYSKLMCWVALDRGLRLAEKRSLPADRDRWIRARDAIYEEVMTKGWNESRLAGRGPDPGAAGGGGPAHLREDAQPRQPPRALRRTDWSQRRGPGELPPGRRPDPAGNENGEFPAPLASVGLGRAVGVRPPCPRCRRVPVGRRRLSAG